MGLFMGKVVVVTGAGSGLGREYALAFASNGASVVVNDYGVAVTAEKLATNPADDVVTEITALGGTAVANTASVSDWLGAESIIETAVTHFGRLDAVVNNAGNNRPSSLVELSELDLDSQIDVHLKGTLAVSHFAAQHWNKVGAEANRAIVNTTSAVGLHPTAGGGVYGAAKAGIAAATVSHAQELARLGVKVNALAPCARTRMVKESPSVLAMMPESIEFDRHAPEHNAPLVAYLASAACDFTGETFFVKGGEVTRVRSWERAETVEQNDRWGVSELTAALNAMAAKVKQ
jgi:NAD(P)-dependent dehydrogenase (short-subunit alcohol dehydrogenase family)